MPNNSQRFWRWKRLNSLARRRVFFGAARTLGIGDSAQSSGLTGTSRLKTIDRLALACRKAGSRQLTNTHETPPAAPRTERYGERGRGGFGQRLSYDLDQQQAPAAFEVGFVAAIRLQAVMTGLDKATRQTRAGDMRS